MAKSPAHRFGQIIGDMLEEALKPHLSELADKHGLFLDSKGPRTARKGPKVSWRDEFGNNHDLDFVFERGGSETKSGVPIAFIESAWRRYTKHSKNKVQEIEGAILPLVSTHRTVAPFIGAVLAGEFTSASLEQLRSRGFSVLHFPYETVIKAFNVAHVDASFGEDTLDEELARRVSAWDALNSVQRQAVAESLIASNSKALITFSESLERALTRQISSVSILPLHGRENVFDEVDKAIHFLNTYDSLEGNFPLFKYEVIIRYNNGSILNGQFTDNESTIDFLRTYLPPNLKLVE